MENRIEIVMACDKCRQIDALSLPSFTPAAPQCIHDGMYHVSAVFEKGKRHDLSHHRLFSILTIGAEASRTDTPMRDGGELWRFLSFGKHAK